MYLAAGVFFSVKMTTPGFDQSCCCCVAKISMLGLNIGSGKLSSCMLSIGLGPKCEQGKGGAAPPLALNGFGFSTHAEHA